MPACAPQPCSLASVPFNQPHEPRSDALKHSPTASAATECQKTLQCRSVFRLGETYLILYVIEQERHSNATKGVGPNVALSFPSSVAGATSARDACDVMCLAFALVGRVQK